MPSDRIAAQRPEWSIAEIVDFLEAKAPSSTAETWDNVGLLVGDRTAKISSAVVALDLTQPVLDRAIQTHSGLIVIHHPCIFPKQRGLNRLNPDRSLAVQALQANVAVFSAHTNFDQCALEVVTGLSSALGLTPKGRLHEGEGALRKLVLFTPASHLAAVQDAAFEAGAGQIGRYDRCGFGQPGTGTFRAGEGAAPFVGKLGQTESVEEVRFEALVPRGLLPRVLKAVLAAHPYEEVAYDIFAVEQRPSPQGVVRGLGYGFWGDFTRPKSFPDVLQDVKRAFNVPGGWVTPGERPVVKRVGYVPGKGSSFVAAAMNAGCDVFVTGEVGFHSAREASQGGMAVIEVGHRQSESYFSPTIAGWLKERGIPSIHNYAPEVPDPIEAPLQSWMTH